MRSVRFTERLEVRAPTGFVEEVEREASANAQTVAEFIRNAVRAEIAVRHIRRVEHAV